MRKLLDGFPALSASDIGMGFTIVFIRELYRDGLNSYMYEWSWLTQGSVIIWELWEEFNFEDGSDVYTRQEPLSIWTYGSSNVYVSNIEEGEPLVYLNCTDVGTFFT